MAEVPCLRWGFPIRWVAGQAGCLSPPDSRDGYPPPGCRSGREKVSMFPCLGVETWKLFDTKAEVTRSGALSSRWPGGNAFLGLGCPLLRLLFELLRPDDGGEAVDETGEHGRRTKAKRPGILSRCAQPPLAQSPVLDANSPPGWVNLAWITLRCLLDGKRGRPRCPVEKAHQGNRKREKRRDV